jgi:hypothetical protein
MYWGEAGFEFSAAKLGYAKILLALRNPMIFCQKSLAQGLIQRGVLRSD